MKKLKAIQSEIKRMQMANKILRTGAKSTGQKQYTSAAFNRALTRRVRKSPY